eukprot:Skav216528  [mRNA]  locus=scaffold1003:301242:304151:- [translate_table: standard]
MGHALDLGSLHTLVYHFKRVDMGHSWLPHRSRYKEFCNPSDLLERAAEQAIAEAAAAAKAEAEKAPSRSCSRESRDSTDMPKRPAGHQVRQPGSHEPPQPVR